MTYIIQSYRNVALLGVDFKSRLWQLFFTVVLSKLFASWFRLSFISASLFCLTVSPAWSDSCCPQSTALKIYSIGNSFAQDATFYLPDFVKAAGAPYSLTLGVTVIPGASLERQCEFIEADKNKLLPDKPSFESNFLPKESKKSHAEALALEKWDFVTIQQASILSPRLETYQPFATKLRDLIKKLAPQAKLVIHQTWAYREDAWDYGKNFGGLDAENMYQRLTANYEKLSKDFSAPLIPVGDAFHKVMTHPDWRFERDPKFDYTTKPPENLPMPEEHKSLHAGAKWKLNMDTHHAGIKGKYLGAAVWFEFFYGKDVREVAFLPEGLSASEAAFLREVAHEAVIARKK